MLGVTCRDFRYVWRRVTGAFGRVHRAFSFPSFPPSSRRPPRSHRVRRTCVLYILIYWYTRTESCLKLVFIMVSFGGTRGRGRGASRFGGRGGTHFRGGRGRGRGRGRGGASTDVRPVREEDGTQLAERFEQVALNDDVDEKLGFARISEGSRREGWLINMHPVSTSLLHPTRY